MKRFKKLLVVADTRLDEHPVVHEGAEIASANKASLTIVDVVPASSWIADLVTAELASMRELYAQEAQRKLEALAVPLRDKGLDVTTRVLTGKTSVEAIREVLREKHDLVLAVAKGKHSKRKGFFGYTALHLLRDCPSAVWLVTRESAAKINHVLGCVDVSSDHPVDVELNDKVYELVSSLAGLQNARCSILHAWQMQDEALLISRLTKEHLAEFVRDHRNATKERFDEFLIRHGSSVDSETAHLVKGSPAQTIEKFTQEYSVDLIVMGTVSRSGLAGMLLGNTAEQIIDRIECSLIALKPYDFTTSITLKRSREPTAS
jgi:nucleotide-binding universal stress UspA family protein